MSEFGGSCTMRMARAAAAGLVTVVALAIVGTTAAAQTEACAGYAVYSALGSAIGIRAIADAPGVTLFSSVDANVPGSQAELDSIGGSIGWAGAPYSETVSGNIGVAGGVATPNDVPTFAVSSFPAEPHEVEKSIGAGNLRAQSGASSSTSSSAIGAAVGDTGVGYGLATDTSAGCADDGTLYGEAEAVVSALDVGGVLRIGSVRSHARIEATPAGVQAVEGTIAVEGVSVLGQAVGFSDAGLVLGPTVVPLGENPLQAALDDAGVTVRVLEATTNEAEGFVIAPALEITVSRQVDGVGSGPVTVRYLVGQAFARAGTTALGIAPRTPLPPAPGAPQAASGAPVAAPVGPAAAPVPVIPAPSAAAGPAAAMPAGAAVPLAGQLIDWSILPAFSALATGGVVFLVSWFALGRVVVRYRWS